MHKERERQRETDRQTVRGTERDRKRATKLLMHKEREGGEREGRGRQTDRDRQITGWTD